MVVVTKKPDRDPVQSEIWKQAEYVSKTITDTHLELRRDVTLKASAIEKTHEIARNYRTGGGEVPAGLHHCKELIKIAMRDKEPVLLKECCDFLIAKLRTANVLEVYTFLSEVEPKNDGVPLPSAPPITETNVGCQWNEFSAETITNVKRKCDKIINKHAYEVFLHSEQVAMLSYNDLQAILKRDDLCIPQEEILYNAMYEWGRCRCPEGDTKYLQKILRDLPKLIRYGLMKPKVFKKLKGVKDFLDEKDWRMVRFHVDEKAKGRDPYNLPYRWSKPRSLPSDGTQIQVGTKRSFESFGIQCLMCWMVIFD